MYQKEPKKEEERESDGWERDEEEEEERKGAVSMSKGWSGEKGWKLQHINIYMYQIGKMEQKHEKLGKTAESVGHLYI